MESATLLFRRMFLSLTRPLAELTRICDPSRSNQTGVTCGRPSGIKVARWANATLLNRSLYLPGMEAAIYNLLQKQTYRWRNCAARRQFRIYLPSVRSASDCVNSAVACRRSPAQTVRQL